MKYITNFKAKPEIKIQHKYNVRVICDYFTPYLYECPICNTPAFFKKCPCCGVELIYPKIKDCSGGFTQLFKE